MPDGVVGFLITYEKTTQTSITFPYPVNRRVAVYWLRIWLEGLSILLAGYIVLWGLHHDYCRGCVLYFEC